ncbi:MAG: TolC family protein, partial [Fuerstiella sp.]
MPRPATRSPLLRSHRRLATAARLVIATTLVTVTMTGCSTPRATVCDLDYCDDKSGIQYYRGNASSVSYPCLDKRTAEVVAASEEPRNLHRRIEDPAREIALNEALQIALSHNEVIETSALGGVGSKAVLTNPTGVASVYDPAIQASGVLFGRRSVESALADFDTTFASSLTWRRNDVNAGNLNGGGNRADFTSSLSKQFATGASISLSHDWTHTVDPATYGPVGAGTFTPNYYGRLGAQVRQPLLAGSGVSYTRIAGPANPNFGSITGVSQGVVIARINEDISVASFELAVRDALRDIEDAYWTLYFAYRTYDTAVVAHKSAFQTWRESQHRLEVGVLKPADELQARDRLYETKASVETSLNSLFRAESELRRLVGLPMNDGTVLRPSEEPNLAEFIPDWKASLREGLTNRTELRRQKWSLKSLQLQLQAARSLVRPRFDFIAGYDVNGVGDTLLSDSDSPFRSAYGSMTNEDINSWNAGFLLTVPIGQRFNRSQVRNLELQVTRAAAVLASQEKNIAHDIATAIQDVTATYAAAQTNYKRLTAASRRVDLLQAEREVGTLTLDLVLRAQASRAAAENAYYQQVVDYNRALMNLSFAKGTLLADNGIILAEGPWQPEAYCDALLRAQARTHAVDAPHLCTEPAEFASPGPTGTVELYPASDAVTVEPEFHAPASEQAAPEVPELPPVDAPSEPGATQSRLQFSKPLPIVDPLKDGY